MPDIEQVNEEPTTGEPVTGEPTTGEPVTGESTAGESAILTAVKTSLHVTDNDLDDELNGYISEALEDMRRVGVTAATDDTESPLVTGCVVLYVKWMVSYLGEPERFRSHYERRRDALSQGSDYNAES